MTSRVFVTGGGGFIGRHLLAALRVAGCDVAAPVRAELDLTDMSATRAAVAAFRPDAIVHLASAAIATPGSSDAALIDAEVALVDTLLHVAPVAARFLLAGSVAEYGHAHAFPEQPHTVYGAAKLAATRHVLAVARDRGLDASVVRIFGAYGLGEAASRLFPTLLAAAGTTGPIALSDGMQARDFVHVGDVAAAIVALLAPRGAASVLDIGTGHPVRLRDAILRVTGELGIDPERLAFGAIPRRVTDADCVAADTAALARAIGWVPPQRLAGDAPVLPLFGAAAGLHSQE